MNSLGKQFESLLIKHDVLTEDIRTPGFMRERYKQEAHNLINSFKRGARIGIYGIGPNAVHFLGIAPEGFYQHSVVCLIDNDLEKHEPFKSEKEYKKDPKPVITSDHIHEYNLDAVIIVHFNSRKAIRKHIADICPALACYDLYETLSVKGIDYELPYWRHDFYFRKQFLEKNKLLYEYKMLPSDAANKTDLLKRLISHSLSYKDFYNTELLIRDYVFLELPGYQKYDAFWSEFCGLITDARAKIRSRENKHIFVFGIDSLTPAHINDMRFVKFMSETCGIAFENAVSLSDWTTFSYKSLISGKSFYSDRLYAKDSLTEDNCISIKNFKNHGYKTKFMGCLSSVLKSIRDINNIDNQLFEKYTQTYMFFASELYWDWLCDLYEEEGRAVYFLHSMLELHPPTLNNLNNHINTDFPPLYRIYSMTGRAPYDFNEDDVPDITARHKKQISDGCMYLDRIIEFYSQFFDLRNDTIVFMGDHGQNYENVWKLMKSPEDLILSPSKPILNPGLIIADKSLSPHAEKKYFSYKQLMNALFELKEGGGEITPYLSDYAIGESCPFYSIILFAEELHSKDQCQKYGYITIFTETEKYIRYTNGVEKYYILPNEYYERDNLASQPQYVKRLEWFRSLIKDVDFIDLYNYEAFDTAKKVLIDKTITFDMLNDALIKRKANKDDTNILQHLKPEHYRKEEGAQLCPEY